MDTKLGLCPSLWLYSVLKWKHRKRSGLKGLTMNTDVTYAEQIAAEYAPKDTSRVVALRKLDRRAKLPANIFAYAFGIVSALVMGTGMCLSMGVIGGNDTLSIGVGIAIGIVGLAMMGLNYLIYQRILANGKRRYAADIVRLASDIARGEKDVH